MIVNLVFCAFITLSITTTSICPVALSIDGKHVNVVIEQTQEPRSEIDNGIMDSVHKVIKRDASKNTRSSMPSHLSNLITERLFEDYSKGELPNGDKPTEIRIGVYINTFNSISESTMQYNTRFYFRQSWQDKRLRFDSSVLSLWNNSILSNLSNEQIPNSILLLPEHFKENMFLPDIFFRNGEVNALKSDDIDWHNSMMKVNQSGHVWYVRQVATAFGCPMKLQKFPMDTQMCPMIFESFKYTSDQMYFTWLDSPVDVDPAIRLSQFSLIDIILRDCSQSYTAGVFPCLEMDFVLKRDLGYFILQTFLPSILVVILSWTVFWVDMDSGAQVTLEVMLVLTVVTVLAAANQTLPRVSYVKAIDIWSFCCLFMVCGALVECSIVDIMLRKVKITHSVDYVRDVDSTDANRKNVKNRLNHWNVDGIDDSNPDSGVVDPLNVSSINKEDKIHNERWQKRAKFVEHFSRLSFPTFYLIFNIVFWFVYCFAPSAPGDG